MIKTTRWLVRMDGTTAFREKDGGWYDNVGTCVYKVLGTDVIRSSTGDREFYIIDAWVFDEAGIAVFYYGR